MTKTEFLNSLEHALKHNGIPDAADVVNEYEQHFLFKLADGYTEEEVAAKLGDPLALAAQFCTPAVKSGCGRKCLTVIGLCFSDLFAACFFLLLLAWELVMIALPVSCVFCAVLLLSGVNLPSSVIPYIPYWCGAVFSLTLLALATLSAVGFVYFSSFFRQLFRSYKRFHYNAFAATAGKPVLPPQAVHPRFSPKTARRLRSVALLAVVLLAFCFFLSMAAAMLSSRSLEFWHTWGWFGYPAA